MRGFVSNSILGGIQKGDGRASQAYFNFQAMARSNSPHIFLPSLILFLMVQELS